MATRVLFITGTDTNVGKTTITGLATAHLAKVAINFRAVKPFCSGERADAQVLHSLQNGRVSLQEINPFYFSEPLSPWTAARKVSKAVSLGEALNYLRQQASTCDLLLVEGAGGLLSPLGDRVNAADLIVQLGAEVIVVAGNRLGVLNHTMLTVEALARRNVKKIKIALVDLQVANSAAHANQEDLQALMTNLPVFCIPFLPAYKMEGAFFRAAAERLHDPLEKLLSPASVSVTVRDGLPQ